MGPETLVVVASPLGLHMAEGDMTTHDLCFLHSPSAPDITF